MITNLLNIVNNLGAEPEQSKTFVELAFLCWFGITLLVEYAARVCH